MYSFPPIFNPNPTFTPTLPLPNPTLTPALPLPYVDSIASGSHLCFIGSGKPSEDQYLHMIISNMLRRYSKYVSICVGGYQGRPPLDDLELRTNPLLTSRRDARHTSRTRRATREDGRPRPRHLSLLSIIQQS